LVYHVVVEGFCWSFFFRITYTYYLKVNKFDMYLPIHYAWVQVLQVFVYEWIYSALDILYEHNL